MTRVLLVDDSPVMRHYVARALQMTGLEIAIYEAENGLVAMEKACEIRPDVIITDLNMPEMSGLELVSKVQAAAGLSATRVLVLSADRSAGRHDELARAGAHGWLTKPVTPEALRSSLLAVLEARPSCSDASRHHSTSELGIPAEVVRSATEQIFRTMYFGEARYCGSARIGASALGTVLGFSGEVSGEFHVAVSENLAWRMAADFLALEEEEVSPEQIEATVREFANVACGATISAWKPEAAFRFSIPEPLSQDSNAGAFPHCFSIAGDLADLAIDVRIVE